MAVIFTFSFCFLTRLLANLSNDFPFSLFPKNNNILNLLLLLISSGKNLFLDLNAQFIKFNAGPVIKVVTKAIITIMVKTCGVSTFKSNPIFKTTNSINPRVFIKAPIVRLSFQLCPTNFAANALPKNFPTTATNIIKPVTCHI